MAEENIIFPDEPLLIVERGWTQNDSRSTQKGQQTTRFDVLRTPTPGPGRDNPTGSASAPARRTSRPSRRDFQFVAATEPDGRHDSKSQRLVRSHVRKQSSRREGIHSDTPRRGSAADIAEIKSLPGPERRASADPDTFVEKHTSTNTLAREQASPKLHTRVTHCYPILRTIFHPLTSYFSYHPDPSSSDWYQTLDADTLLLEAVQVINLMRSPVATDWNSDQIRELMKSIHQQLIDRVGKEQISDATIGTVLCLAIVEYRLEDKENYEMHKRGLLNMINHRGGIQNLKRMLQMRIYIADVCGTTDQLKQPHFAQPQFVAHILRAAQNTTTTTRMTELTSLEQMDHGLQNSFNDMAILASELNNADETGHAIDLVDFEEACICILYSLGCASISAKIDQIYRCSGLIFMRPMTREQAWAGYASRLVAAHLRSLLESARLEMHQNSFALWVAYLGAMTAMETPDYDWFLQLVRDFSRSNVDLSWEYTKQELSKVLWIGQVHDQAGQRVWNATRK